MADHDHWKSSNDPHFIAKMQRILALYDTPPKDGRVICVDEFGPLNLQPRKDKAWRPPGHPARLRATYHHNDGVRHLPGALEPGHQPPLLPHPRPQTVAGVPVLPQVPARTLA